MSNVDWSTSLTSLVATNYQVSKSTIFLGAEVKAKLKSRGWALDGIKFL